MKKNRSCVVGPRILRNRNFLKLLSITKCPKEQLILLKNATNDQLLSIVEIVANIVQFHTFCLNKKEIAKLLPYEKYMIRLAKNECPKKARSMLQKGRGPFLLSLLVPVLSAVASHFLK